MLLIKIKRVLRAGFLNFWRNGWVSLTAILIMTVTLFSIGSVVFSRVVLGSMLAEIQERVDISVYFKADAGESDILSLQKTIEVLPEVKRVEYISSGQALVNFRERHKDNTLIIQSLDELEENPLGAVLNVRAMEVSQYEGIAKFLENESASVKGADTIIDKITYFQNKKIINTLSKLISSTKRLGLWVSLILIIISVLVVFNTIGLVIYSSREEIEVMKLVGASNRFASGPFVVEGAIYGVLASLITTVLFYPVVWWLGPITKNFFGGISIYEYYIQNFGQIFVLLLLAGIALGSVSSFIATRRYLKI